MNKLLSIITISLFFVPFSFAWSDAECKAVNYDHPDCVVPGTKPPSSPPPSGIHSSHSGGGHFIHREWYPVSFVPLGCTTYVYILVHPPLHYPGEPTIVVFGDRSKKVCT